MTSPSVRHSFFVISSLIFSLPICLEAIPSGESIASKSVGLDSNHLPIPVVGRKLIAYEYVFLTVKSI